MEPWTNLISILYHLADTLEQFLPLLVVVLTNIFVIITAIFVLSVGKKYTSFQCYVDDDIRFLVEDDQLIDESKKIVNSPRMQKLNGIIDPYGFVLGHHVYMIRLYFLNYWQLDDLPPEAINESGEIEAVNEPTDEWDTLIIELLDGHKRHITKLQLDYKFLRASYRSKFESRSKSLKKLARWRKLEAKEIIALKANGNVFYQVKFLFERATPLRSVSFARARKLTNNNSVILYRIEISDTKDANRAFVSNVVLDPPLQAASCLYYMTKQMNYTPEPYDRSFNTTKVIWTEMCLLFLCGLDILTIVSLSMLNYFEKSVYDSKEIMWTMAFLGTVLPGLVAFNALLYYRVATNHFPAWRKRTQDVFHWLLTIIVVVLGLAGVYAAVHNSLIYKYKELKTWVRGYFIALVFYNMMFVGAILADFFFLYKI